MDKKDLTSASPFRKRLAAYFAERFPLSSHLSMVVIYVLANQFLAQILCEPEHPMRIGWFTLLGMISLFGLFLHLRVFDEHKDYADDCRFYPDRILSRGLITLRHLKILGGTAIAAEFIAAGLRGAQAIVAVSVTFLFSWIMLHEFFVRRWLRAHFIVYAIAHMLIMPFMAATVFSFTMRQPFWEAPFLFWVYAVADFLAFSNWEISRKIRMPEDEVEGLASYSKELGLFTSCVVVLVLRLLNTFLAWMVGVYLHLGPLYYGGLIVLFFGTLVGVLHFWLKPSRRTAKQLEAYGGWYIIFFYFVLAAELFRLHGVTFTGDAL
ncbi:MAG TPA: hypothetical protein PLW27_00830 [Kiritimatiellia bacterium]|jgi:4-hydroxybenzoate polyprenyltransferase|nr:hypothetical protein [Kiritimatiellia bacterium]HQL50194.1 hypothetical protein [Kiritimatiellia bacterium]